MAEIPLNTVSEQDLFIWYKMQQELNKLKAAEHLLRVRIFNGMFPTPREGTNNRPIEITPGYVLKGDYVINRKIDIALLNNLKPQFGEHKIPDSVIKYTPELAIKEYRVLTAEQQAFFNQCLEIKPGSPQMKIEPTTEKKAELAQKAASAPSIDLSPLVIPKL